MADRFEAWRTLVSRPLSSGSSKGFVIAGLVAVFAAALIGRSRGAIVAADFGALTLGSLAGWMVLFMIGAAASQTMGSDAGVFLFPLMLFPVTLILGGLLRLVRRATHRAPPGEQAP